MQHLLHLYMSPGPLGIQILFCHQVLLFSVVWEKFEHHRNKDPPVQRLLMEAPACVLIGCGFRTTSVFKELAPPSQRPGKLKMCFHRQCFSSLQSSVGHVLNVGPSAPRGFLPWLVLFIKNQKTENRAGVHFCKKKKKICTFAEKRPKKEIH